IAFSKGNDTQLIQRTSCWFFIANIFNVAWLFAWLSEWTLTSVAIMLGIFFSLLQIIINTNTTSLRINRIQRLVTGWPIGIYFGWISVALIANIAAYLAKINWKPVLFDATGWTVTLIIVAVGINLFVLFRKNLVSFSLVGIWAFVAIYFRHLEDQVVISNTAIFGAFAITVSVIYHIKKFFFAATASDR
ncbi:MAG: tryptophan-rich sensory protein, partial [Bacteroidota bacterium]